MAEFLLGGSREESFLGLFQLRAVASGPRHSPAVGARLHVVSVCSLLFLQDRLIGFRASSTSVCPCLNYILQNPVPKYGHILRFQEDLNMGGTLFNPVYTFFRFEITAFYEYSII